MTAIPRLRRPEHTGDSRCWPCTVVNVVILAVAVAVVALVAPTLAGIVALAGVVTIWFRGYLVPYTPRFAPRIAAWLPGDSFAHTDTSETLGDLNGADVDGDDVLAELIAVGIVDGKNEHLQLAEAVAVAWQSEMDALAADSDNRLVDAVCHAIRGVESARVERSGPETFLVVTGADGSTTWLRRPVAIAEVAASQVLDETDFPSEIRGLAAHALCAFLETCPVCDADVVETTPEDCCGHRLSGTTDGHSDVLACETCGVVFYEFQ